MSLGKKLVDHRIKCGLSQEKAAETIGITRTRLSQLECDRAKRLNFDTISKLAEFLKISSDEVVKLL